MLSVVMINLAAAPPTLCVRADLEAGAPVIALKELVPAISARIGRRQLRVALCSVAPAARWQLTVKRQDAQTLMLLLDGVESRSSQTYDTSGQTSAEVVPGVALKAAEALRPSVDGLLAELGLLEEDPAAAKPESSLEKLEALADTPSIAAPAVESPSIRRRITIELGVSGVAGAATPVFNGAAELAVGVAVGPLALVAFGSGSLPTRVSREGVTLSASTLGAGAGVDWVLDTFAIGLRFSARRELVKVASELPNIMSGSQDYWVGVGSLRAAWWPLRFGFFQAGLAALGSVVVSPREYLVRGEPVASQSWVEGALMLGVRAVIE